MQGEKVGGRVASWVAGVVGVWAGVAALGALVAALMSPQWTVVREPIVLSEVYPPHTDPHYGHSLVVLGEPPPPMQEVVGRRLEEHDGGEHESEEGEMGEGAFMRHEHQQQQYQHQQQHQHQHHPQQYQQQQQEHLEGTSRSVLTTITFRLGLWTVCPHLNTSHLQHLHLPRMRAPCSRVSYWWGRVSHEDLHLPAPAPLLQTVLARMRMSTPFLVGACVLLCAGCLLAVVGRCCYTHAALLAALLYSLAGLSVGVGVVWFVSVVSEEYGGASGRGTRWAALYAYQYGWSVLAAGGAGVAALLAALLTGHAHFGRHAPLGGVSRRGGAGGGEEEGLVRPLLRCRSDGCLGQRSITSDTLRTYLTCDSRRPAPRPGPPPPSLQQATTPALNPSPSIVDLTRQHQESSRPPSRRASHATIVADDLHLHHIHHTQQLQEQQQHTQSQQEKPQQPQQQQQQQLQQLQQHQQQQSQQQQEWAGEGSSVIIEATDIPAVVPPPPFTSPSPISPLDLPPPPPVVVKGTGGGVSKRACGEGASVGGRSRGESVGEPQRLPEYNSFRSGHHTHSLPREARQLSVFSRRPAQRSATLARPSKASSEV